MNKNFSRHFILIGILLGLCLTLNYVIYNKLNNDNEKTKLSLLHLYAKQMEGLILKDFLKLFQNNYTINDLSIIKYLDYEVNNQDIISFSRTIYISNNILHIRSANKSLTLDLSHIKEILNTISENLFVYSVSINNKQILTNTLIDLTDNILLNTSITEDFLLTLSLKHKESSLFNVLSDRTLKTNILLTIWLSTGVFFLGVFIIFRFLSQSKKLAAVIDHKNSILFFVNKEKEFIIQCYEYSKNPKDFVQDEIDENRSNDYLPLSIAHNIKAKKEVDVFIDKIILEVKDYFVSYKKYYQLNNINLDIINHGLEKITMPFDYEIFYQIMISIIHNLMNFNKKSVEQRKLVIIFMENEICINSNGLKLNKEYAIKASSMIFQDTANPYLMNFGQMFVLFNRYNIKFNISYDNSSGTNINMLLPSKEKVKNTGFEVIKFNQYKRNKK